MKRNVLFASALGNALEWYDYSLYGHFALIIGNLFFPSDTHAVSLIMTFAVFACGFFSRPLGGVVFGYIGDKYGRRFSLVSAILMMTIPTALIGVVPGYNTIGVIAPILLIIMRLLQGLSMGGAFSGTMIFMVEHATPGTRGLVGSISVCSLGIGFLLGSTVATTCSLLIPEESFISWGWRIPFILSILFSFVAIYIQRYTTESAIYLDHKEKGECSDNPVMDTFKFHKLSVFRAFSAYLTITVPFYTYSVFVNNFISNILKQGLNQGLIVNICGMLTLTIVAPFAAYLSDRIGRKPILITASALIILYTYPYFKILSTGNIIYQILAQILFAAIHACYFGPLPSLLVELFPTKIRYTGMSVSYNISVALFGGTLPMIAMWLIHVTGSSVAVSWYVTAFVVLTLVNLLYIPETYDKELQ